DDVPVVAELVVGAGTSVDEVTGITPSGGTAAPDHVVLVEIAVEVVGTGVALDVVVACAAVGLVVTTLAADDVVVVVAPPRVAGATADDVGPVVAFDVVVAVVAFDGVVAALSEDHVVAVAAGEHRLVAVHVGTDRGQAEHLDVVQLDDTDPRAVGRPERSRTDH